jgi:hypothetical protein
LSWHRILNPTWRVGLGAAADYSWYEGDGTAASAGGLARLNMADLLSLSARITMPVQTSGLPSGGVSALILFSIEPRLWCEHVTRERCEPSWFLKSLIP